MTTCAPTDKAVIVFDQCCIDWTDYKDALVAGSCCGLTFAWCGVDCNVDTTVDCGKQTYVAMTACELIDVFGTPTGQWLADQQATAQGPLLNIPSATCVSLPAHGIANTSGGCTH